MPIIFKPYGNLDVSSDPALLEDGDMTRCKNLRLNEKGVAHTRDGSDVISSSAMTAVPGHIIEQAGSRYSLGTSIYEDEVSIGSGYTSADWKAILYNAFNDTTQNIFALNGTERKRIEGGTVYDWGHIAPSATPSVVVGNGTALTGGYNAKVSYARKKDSTVVFETDLSSAASAAVTLSAQSLQVHIDISELIDTTAQLTHLRLYRTLAGGATYYLDSACDLDIEDLLTADYGYIHAWETTDAYISGTGFQYGSDDGDNRRCCYSWEVDYSTETSQYSFTGTLIYDSIICDSQTTDASLGTEEHTNHDRPPAGTFVLGPNYDGYCFILKDNLFYFCLAKQPEYWPVSYFVEVSPPHFPLKAGCFWNGLPYVATEHDIYQIQGTGPQTFFPVRQSATTGTKSADAFLSVAGLGVFHVGSDGLYLFNNVSDRNLTHGSFRKLFRGETCGAMPGVDNLTNCILKRFENDIFFGYRASGNAYPQHFIVYNLDDQKTTYFDWGIEITAMGVDRTNGRLLGVDSAGDVYQLEGVSYTDDNGTAISWDIESKEYTLPTRAHFPRWAKYDVDASGDDCSATGQIKLDGTALQSHTITGDRLTKRRLITTGNGGRCSMRVSGSGPVSIYTIESE